MHLQVSKYEICNIFEYSCTRSTIDFLLIQCYILEYSRILSTIDFVLIQWHDKENDTREARAVDTSFEATGLFVLVAYNGES